MCLRAFLMWDFSRSKSLRVLSDQVASQGGSDRLLTSPVWHIHTSYVTHFPHRQERSVVPPFEWFPSPRASPHLLGRKHSDMYHEKLNKLISQVCHAWEEQHAEYEGKMRSLANSIVAEHETERFNTQKAFKSALAAKNNEINALLSECKKLKALVTHIHSENKELQKKLTAANRTIELLRQGVPYEDNLTKKAFSEDATFLGSNDDTLSIGSTDYYGNLDDISVSSQNQLPNWNPQNNRMQQPQFYPRDRPYDVDNYAFNQTGYHPELEQHGRSSAPPANSSGGMGGLFSSSSQPQLPTRQGPLVYGGRYVLDSAGDEPYQREDFRVDKTSSDLARFEKDAEELRQPFHDERDARHNPEAPPSQVFGSKRLSPSASPFMPGGTPSPIGRNMNGPAVVSAANIGNKSSTGPIQSELQSAPPGFEAFSSEHDQIYSPPESGRPSTNSIGSITQLNESSSALPLPPPGLEEDPSGSAGDQSPNETANLLTQMRLQSKSSKLDAKPLSTQVSPIQSTVNPSDSP